MAPSLTGHLGAGVRGRMLFVGQLTFVFLEFTTVCPRNGEVSAAVFCA